MRYLLIPFAILYGSITTIRNLLFDFGIFKSKAFNLPIISIGNLAVGGTGKTPHTDYIINLLKKEYKVATLSRGYGRKTNDFLYVTTNSKADKVGDEPLQLKQKHPNCIVAVDKDRRKGIQKIINDHPNINVILLDDAFQHRWVKVGLNILLTTYTNLYTKDFMLPAGNLRESSKGAERADIIIISKCPKSTNPTEKKGISSSIKTHIQQKCYFSHINYGNYLPLFDSPAISNKKEQHINLITGIANPKPLLNFLEENQNLTHHKFKDHHNFKEKEIVEIVKLFHKNKATKKIILTTEKDAKRLIEFKSLLKDIPIYYIPIEIEIENTTDFNKRITEYVANYKRNS